MLEQAGSEHAVVVREGDELRADLGQADIASPREPARGAKPLQRERVVPTEDMTQSIVLVLVDHEHTEAAPMGLGVEGVEQAPELVGPVDRGDHEVE